MFIKRILVYCATLLLCLMAGWTTRLATDKINVEEQSIQRVLQLSAARYIDFLEFLATRQEKHDTISAESVVETVVEEEEAAVEYDTEMERTYEQEEAAFEQRVQTEQEELHDILLHLNQSENLHAELVDKLEQERQEKQQLEAKGLCSWWGVSTVCQTIGAVPELQTHNNITIGRQIQMDMKHLNRTQQEEYILNVTAEKLRKNITDDQEVAAILQQTAVWWKHRANVHKLEEAEWNNTLTEIRDTEERLQNRMKHYRVYMAHLSEDMKDNLHTAARAKRASQISSVIALLVACIALAFLLLSAIPRFVSAVSAALYWYDRTSTQCVWHIVSYSAVHMLLFVTIARAFQNEWAAFQSDLPAAQRTVVMTYFSMVCAAVQCAGLHVIPHLVTEGVDEFSVATAFVQVVGKYALLQTMCLMPIFFLEFLFVWLSPMRDWVLLQPNSAFSMLLLLAGYAGFMYHWINYYQMETSSSKATVLESFSESSWTEYGNQQSLRSERTPLSTTSTDLFPEAYMSAMQQNSRPHSSSTSSYCHPIYFVSVRDELRKVLIPFEMLLCYCMVLVINVGLENLLGPRATLMVFLLLLLLTLTVALSITLRKACSNFGDIGVPRVLYV